MYRSCISDSLHFYNDLKSVFQRHCRWSEGICCSRSHNWPLTSPVIPTIQMQAHVRTPPALGSGWQQNSDAATLKCLSWESSASARNDSAARARQGRRGHDLSQSERDLVATESDEGKRAFVFGYIWFRVILQNYWSSCVTTLIAMNPHNNYQQPPNVFGCWWNQYWTLFPSITEFSWTSLDFKYKKLFQMFFFCFFFYTFYLVI